MYLRTIVKKWKREQEQIVATKRNECRSAILKLREEFPNIDFENQADVGSLRLAKRPVANPTDARASLNTLAPSSSSTDLTAFTAKNGLESLKVATDGGDDIASTGISRKSGNPSSECSTSSAKCRNRRNRAKALAAIPVQVSPNSSRKELLW